MLRKKPTDPELLPGAAESDCQTAALPEVEQVTEFSPDEEEEDEHPHDVTWESAAGATAVAHSLDSWRIPRHRWTAVLENIALALESPVNRLIGNTQLNPFYQTGPIATFLLGVVGLTGLYLFFFFQYGFDASYNAVANMEGQAIARLIRAVHRYASGALVITTLLHAFRTLFMERFRGPRWLAWITGLGMTALLWMAGVTGYWLIWDERAQLITDGFINFLRPFGALAPRLTAYLVSVEGSSASWLPLLLIFAVHLLLFLVVAGFFWLHILRLKRPRWYPDLLWVGGLSAVLLLVSLFFPAGMLPQADPTRLPEQIAFDPIFLFYLPLLGTNLAPFLWGGLLLATAVFTALPWASKAKRPSAVPLPPPKVNIIHERCTGCTKCALDCPYGAIEMVERHDGKPHKYIALANPDLCVGCGICVGSCDGVAVTLGQTPPELLWETVATRLALANAKAPEGVKLIFTCERHAAHGAQPYVNGTTQNGLAVTLVTLPCAGTAPPDLMVRALNAGAAEVQVVGCPPADCANREGNLWAEQRLLRERLPRLKREYAAAPITALWLPPNEFAQAVKPAPLPPPEERQERRRMAQPVTWRNGVVAFTLLALVMLAQVLLTDFPLRPYADRPAVLQAVLADPALAYERYGLATAVPLQFTLFLDGAPVATQPIPAAQQNRIQPDPLVAEQRLTPGSYHVTLTLSGGAAPFTLFDRTVTLAPGEVLRVGYDPSRTGNCYGSTCLKRVGR